MFMGNTPGERSKLLEMYRGYLKHFEDKPDECQYHEVTALLGLFRVFQFALEATDGRSDPDPNGWVLATLHRLEDIHERMIGS